jgi:regulator of sigma E protease
MTFVYFILFIGPLIFVHELGHFLFAKLFDVKVLKFSLGFGPRAVGFHKGETEYVVAWFPLGGYVKMLGEDPNDEIRPEDYGRAFNQKPLWQRYIVVLAGPAFNLIFPIIIYFVFFAGQSHMPPAVVGRTIPGRPAAEAGLQPGDRIVAIDGTEVRYWEEMKDLIADRAGEPLRFTIERDGQRFDRFITPQEQVILNRLNMTEREGQIGISPFYDLALIGITGPDTAAARAGLRTGDLVTSVNGAPVERWDQLERILQRNRGQSLNVSYLRPNHALGEPGSSRPSGTLRDEAAALVDLHLLKPAVVVVDPEPVASGGKTVYETGMHSAEFFVRQVDQEIVDSKTGKPRPTPAARIGMKPGDWIVRFDRQPITHWDVIKASLTTPKGSQKIEDTTHTFTWIPYGGVETTKSFKLAKVTFVDDYRVKQDRFVFGVQNYRIWKSADPVPVSGRFLFAAAKAVQQTGEIVGTMAIVVVHIFKGSIPRDTIGGPLMLAYTARAAAEKGWEHFVWMLALISINLGILNLLPIPILDGGHIMFFTIEAAKRRPLSLRAREIASYVGLVLILSLLIFAFRNDIVRYWFK